MQRIGNGGGVIANGVWTADDRARVLLVDDDEELRETLASFLDACSIAAITAASATVALAMFEAARPDLVITDIHMPGNDGVWLLHALRTLDVSRSTPVVALSAAPPSAAMLAAGFDLMLMKPIHPDRIVEVIERYAVARSAACAAS